MIKFSKIESTGNDYIYIDCLKKDLNQFNITELVKKLSDRHFGIGSDGVILICKSNVADCKMVMYNADGSRGLMCGNGIRGLAKYLKKNIYKDKKLFKIETDSGLFDVSIDSDITVTFDSSIYGDTALKKKISINNNKYDSIYVSMGNPHIVIFLDEIDDLNLNELGPNISNNEYNVEFVKIIDCNNIKLRVFERGSGETLSCGTGSCASIYAGILTNRLKKDNEILVNIKGGNLKIKYSYQKIILKGPSNIVFTGEFDEKNFI